MGITYAYVWVKRDGKWQNLDIAELTDAELDTLFNHIPPERNTMWAKFLAGWIRDNVKLTNSPNVLE